MKEIKLKYSLGIFLIASHLVVLLSIILLRFLNGFNTDEFTTLLGIVAPMFVGYTTSVISFLIKDRYRLVFESKTVTKTYASFMYIFPAMFVTIILIAIWTKAYNKTFDDFEDFKKFLLIFEALFAGYVGLFVYSVFKKPISKKEISENETIVPRKDTIAMN